MPGNATQIFLSSLPEEEKRLLHGGVDLDTEITSRWREAQEKWPSLAVTEDDFVPYWAGKLIGLEAPVEAFFRLRVPDLYLAFACGQGSERAQQAFHSKYAQSMRTALRRMRLDEALIDDILQVLLFRVLVSSPEREAKILSYGGRGALSGWLRVIAVRDARAVLQKQVRELPVSNVEAFTAKSLDGYSAILELADDPEFAYLKQHFRSEIKQIFPKALAKLSPKERNLLRLELLDGLHHQQIAKIYNVHRTTILRWLHQAEEQLMHHVHTMIKSNLQVGSTELESLLRVVRSQLSLSIGGAFASEDEK